MTASGSGGIAPDKIRATMFAFALALAALVTAAGFLAATVRPAEALPSYARQTGQPCAACHTAFPELTPFGRRFKIGGYTLGGGDWKGPPIAAMYVPGFAREVATRYAAGTERKGRPEAASRKIRIEPILRLSPALGEPCEFAYS